MPACLCEYIIREATFDKLGQLQSGFFQNFAAGAGFNSLARVELAARQPPRTRAVSANPFAQQNLSSAYDKSAYADFCGLYRLDNMLPGSCLMPAMTTRYEARPISPSVITKKVSSCQ